MRVGGLLSRWSRTHSELPGTPADAPKMQRGGVEDRSILDIVWRDWGMCVCDVCVCDVCVCVVCVCVVCGYYLSWVAASIFCWSGSQAHSMILFLEWSWLNSVVWKDLWSGGDGNPSTMAFPKKYLYTPCKLG